MDYSKYRQTSSEGQAVSVNHRALITRALTKYPVDHALFRELLQNSADAKANSAMIQFHSPSSDTTASSIHTVPINRLLFSNDGDDFYEDDWKRLKEIASGNPNESKIGAFGVGFYSVFELTDEPLVHSGHRIVNFKYHGIQLQFYDMDAPKYQKGTLIDLPYKHEGNLVDIGGFIGFLIQSFLLINLKEIHVEIVYANGQKNTLLHLRKSDGPSRPMTLPPSFVHPSSPFFKLDAVKKTEFSVNGNYLNAAYMPPLTFSKGMFSFGKQLFTTLIDSPKDPNEYTKFNCELLRVDAQIAVSTSQKFKEKITESLLKPPPRKTTISLLSISDSEGDSSTSVAHLNSQLRPYVFPEDPNDAKIFIGFSTKQSTGFRLHLALQSAIPTMERTAIDLSHNYVKEWNYELLRIAGVVVRIAYENELEQCRLCNISSEVNLSNSLEKAKFICSRYKFESSAPDKTIGEHIKAGFYGCATQSLVPSTKGILPNTVVKYTDKNIVSLLKNIPIIEDWDIAMNLSKFVRLYEASPSDIAKDINTLPLNLEEAKIYVGWLREKLNKFNQNDMVSLTSALKVRVGNEGIIDVGSASTYHDRSILSSSIVANYLPRNCIPSNVAQELGHRNLEELFRIYPLTAGKWINMRLGDLKDALVSKNSSQILSSEIAHEILQVASECWSHMDGKEKLQITKDLSTVRCIPTNMGLNYPRDCYIEPIKGFSNFPVVTKKFSPDWLEAIGVRRSINMEVVLSKLSKNELDWSNVDLINYLTTNQSNLKRSDWQILTEGTLFRSDNHNGLFKASSLYAPNQTLTELGFPTLHYDDWNSSFSGAKLMERLNLKKFPSEIDLFKRAVDNKQTSKAISYYLLNMREARYSIHKIENIKFVTTMQHSKLVAPADCFSNPELIAFDKNVISSEYEHLAPQLGVRKAPPTRNLLHEVIRNPQTFLSSKIQREQIFSYFSRHISDLNERDVFEFCKDKEFLPIQSSPQEKIRLNTVWYKPSELYLPSRGIEDSSTQKIRQLLPTYTPSQQSIPFLSLVGVRDQPTSQQLVLLIISDPEGAYRKLNDKDIYEQILCIIGRSWPLISNDVHLVEAMKQAPFLIGERRTSKETRDVEVALYRASQLAIVDDAIIFNQFKNLIVTAPQDRDVEVLYKKLGTPRLSALLKEKFFYKGEFEDQKVQNELSERIQERLKLFIENTKSHLKTKDSFVNIKLVRSIEVERHLPPHAAVRTVMSCCYNSKTDELVIAPHNLDWLDVANALCKKIMTRPEQDSVVVLELQLSASLAALERKGYNIERLRRPLQSNYSLESFLKPTPQPPVPPIETPTTSAHIPGSLPTSNANRTPPAPLPFIPPALSAPSKDTPSASPQPPPPLAPGTARKVSHIPEIPDSMPAGSAQPATDSVLANWVGRIFGVGSGSNDSSTIKKEEPTQEEQIKGLEHVLNQGVSDVREFNEHELTGRSSDNPHGNRGVHVREPNNFNCGSEMEHQLNFSQTLPNGIRVYQDHAGTLPRQDELVLSERLVWIARIFGSPTKAVQLFREKSSTIAFNRNGALFFNSYHLPDTANEMDFWYTVFAHELAHNMCEPHNATHSFFTEGYIRRTLRQYISATSS